MNVNAVVNLPLGFKFNPVVTAHSGLPYTPILGMDVQNDGNDFNDRAVVNGAQAACNALRQPSFFDLDVRFVKDITLKGEGHHLDLFLDVFNVTEFFQSELRRKRPQLLRSRSRCSRRTRTCSERATQVQFTARLVAF